MSLAIWISLRVFLRGELEPVAVDDAGAYEPLSYVWGDNKLPHEIFLPSTRLKLTVSLYHVLRWLRVTTSQAPTRVGPPDLH